MSNKIFFNKKGQIDDLLDLLVLILGLVFLAFFIGIFVLSPLSNKDSKLSKEYDNSLAIESRINIEKVKIWNEQKSDLEGLKSAINIINSPLTIESPGPAESMR